MLDRFTKIVSCENAFIKKINELLSEYKIKRFIKSFNQSLVVDTVYVFEIMLWSGQTYELYVSIDRNLKKTEFVNASSQLDIVLLGSVHYVDLIPCFRKVADALIKRFWGYRLESLVEKHLIDFIESNPDGYLKSIRRATKKEEYRGIDFILTCVMANKEFSAFFDLKKENYFTADSVEKEKKYYSTLHTTEQELKDRPFDFDNKIADLIITRFRKLFLPPAALPELRHVK